MGVSPTDTIIHLTAGGMGGTMGAIVTCPLEVVKTRLQSSNSGFASSPPSSSSSTKSGGVGAAPSSPARTPLRRVVDVLRPEIAVEHRGGAFQTTMPVLHHHTTTSQQHNPHCQSQAWPRLSQVHHMTTTTSMASVQASNVPPKVSSPPVTGVFQCLRLIFANEGIAGLFKGLGPNLMGVAPSRAIYFWAYSTAKRNVNASLPKANRDTPFVHVLSAGMAGFCASSATNPIWLVKTRLQLDRSCGSQSLSIRKCIGQIHKELGIKGFWRGVTASYWGISETVIHFVIYESLKKKLAEYQNKKKNDDKTLFDFAGFMLCGACSKTVATIVAYPHEVARTRLREENSQYRTFWQTLATVYRNEGRRGLYRGLCTQLVRQIPNTAIMMSTYELTVYFLTKWLKVSKNAPQSEDQIMRHKSSHSQ